MGAEFDVYKLIQTFTLAGVEAIITRWYQQTTQPGGASRVGFAWLADVLPEILLLLTDTVTATEVNVQNIDEPADFYINAGALGSGAIIQDPMPPYVAIGLEFPSSDRRLRASTLRLPGIAENVYENDAVTASWVTSFDDLADLMTEVLDAVDSFYDPVLYTPGNVRTSGVPLVLPMISGHFSRITSQNSRKS